MQLMVQSGDMGNTFRHCFAGGCDAVAGAVAHGSPHARCDRLAVRMLDITEFCADYRIRQETGYKWLDRYAMTRRSGLHDGSRRLDHAPLATDPTLREMLIALRDPAAAWPSRSTVCDLKTTIRSPRLAAVSHVMPRGRDVFLWIP